MRHIIQFFIGLLFFSSTAWAQVHELPRSTPEAEGIPSSAISLFLDSLTSYPDDDQLLSPKSLNKYLNLLA